MANINLNEKILITGAAGLVGQNLIIQLKKSGYKNLVCIDKHISNLEILSGLHEEVDCYNFDLSKISSDWEKLFVDVDVVIMLHAQIGAPNYDPFLKNNINATQNVIEAIRKNNIKKLIHVSSSAVNSVAKDYYTLSKREQELLVVESNIPYIILRPTLMFGWFDRKHLGWLSRFMEKTPIFPVPGDGKFLRQPLYEKDFCNVICKAISMPFENKTYTITGEEEVDYIDIIKKIKYEKNLKTIIFKLPVPIFYVILKVCEIVLSNPPFTTQQLKALVAGDKFEVTPWWKIFNVERTQFDHAIRETFSDEKYSKIALKF